MRLYVNRHVRVSTDSMRAHLWWPEDRAWCVASHFDFTSTFVGGSTACIDHVVCSSALEAWPISSLQSITYNSDELN